MIKYNVGFFDFYRNVFFLSKHKYSYILDNLMIYLLNFYNK